MRNTDLMYQAKLVDGQQQMITWLPVTKGLRVGHSILLKDHPNIWVVEELWLNTTVPFDLIVQNLRYDNNNYDKHEGLGV